MRIGTEYAMETWTPRAGYRYIPSPVPTQSGARNDLDNERHLFTLGLGMEWRALRLDFGFQWHHLVHRRHPKNDAEIEAAGFDPDGYPGTPVIEHEGSLWVVGVDLEVTL